MSTIKWSPVVAAAMNRASGVVVIGQPGCGKAVSKDEYVMTPTGKKKAKKVKVGDLLIGKNGAPVKVTGVFPQGKLRLYKVTFGDGRQILCSKDHLFTVGSKSHGEFKYRTLSVEQILEKGLKTSDGACRFAIPNNECIQYETARQKLSPYVFGVFLGNGCKSNGSLILSSPTDEIPMKVAHMLSWDLGRDVVACKNSKSNYSWDFYYKDSFCMEQRQHVRAEDIDADLATLLTNTYSKDRYIPKKYKYASEKQRMDLVRGLFDTDGSISFERGSISYSSSSLRLIYDLAEVLRSLGNAHVSIGRPDVRKENPSYTLYYACAHTRKPDFFTVAPKAGRALRIQNKPSRYQFDRLQIQTIKKLDRKEKCICFTVDAEDHLFLAGDQVVTHNTFFMTNVASHCISMGQRVIALDPKDDFQRLYNINKNIRIVNINNIRPGALNPFEFLKYKDEKGNIVKVDETTIMTILEMLCGKMGKEDNIVISPIIQDFVNTYSYRKYTDMVDIADYLIKQEKIEAQNIGTILSTFEKSRYSELLFTREADVEPLSLDTNESIVITLDGMKLPSYDKDPESYNAEERLSATIVYIIAKKLMQILTTPSKIPTVLFCDEAHLLMNNPEMADIIDRFLSLGRSKNAAIVLASQGITKFPKNIAQYVTTAFLFRSSRAESQAFLELFDNTALDPVKAIDREAVMYRAADFPTGTCFMIDRNNRNGYVHIESIYDPELLTSNPFSKKAIDV